MAESMRPGVETKEKNPDKKSLKRNILMALAAALATGALGEAAEAQERGQSTPWYETGQVPATLTDAFAASQQFLGRDNYGYRMQMPAENQLAQALQAVGLPTDYNHRMDLSHYLSVNGKGLFPNSGRTNPYTIGMELDGLDDVYIGRGRQNEMLADAVQRNATLFEGGLTAEEVKESWR